MPNKLSRFWQELKRQKVIKVIVMYAGSYGPMKFLHLVETEEFFQKPV
jgi:hypothetical protein